MSNCLVAQSGGPTAVINATLAGIISANQLNHLYEHVYGGLYGIEGILQERFVDLTNLSELENKILRQTPSSILGSCRYKLKKENIADFEKLFILLKKHNISTMFYIGGNDSMDTVAGLSDYAKQHAINDIRFIGCPKTVDNDLQLTDHCPGFGSAAKFIATTALATWLDYNVYTRQEVFILETMGRDAGWLAASACLSEKVDLLLLPEAEFNEELFLKHIKEIISLKNKCYIVVSEGSKYADGSYLAAKNAQNDGFGHAILGGAANALKELILANNISERVKVQDLSTAQRAFSMCQSLRDVEESYQLGMSAHMRSSEPSFTGKMIGLKRKEGNYEVEYTSFNANEVANYVKAFPVDWILPNYAGISEEAKNYLRPLIAGSPTIITDNGLPAYLKPFYLNN